MPVIVSEASLTLRLLLDRWSLEIFAGEGETIAAQKLYTPFAPISGKPHERWFFRESRFYEK
jgi:hypothetical protein